MTQIDADVEVLQDALDRVRASAGRSEGWTAPSVSLCGSDDVIDAVVTACRMVGQQETTVRSAWEDLARSAAAGLAELARADASLAGRTP